MERAERRESADQSAIVPEDKLALEALVSTLYESADAKAFVILNKICLESNYERT